MYEMKADYQKIRAFKRKQVKLSNSDEPPPKKKRLSYKLAKGSKTIDNLWKLGTGGRPEVPSVVTDKQLKTQRKKKLEKKQEREAQKAKTLFEVAQTTIKMKTVKDFFIAKPKSTRAFGARWCRAFAGPRREKYGSQISQLIGFPHLEKRKL